MEEMINLRERGTIYSPEICHMTSIYVPPAEVKHSTQNTCFGEHYKILLSVVLEFSWNVMNNIKENL
jgi:hypothetical protein